MGQTWNAYKIGGIEMEKVPESVYEEIENLEEHLRNYKIWERKDKEKIRLLKEVWKLGK